MIASVYSTLSGTLAGKHPTLGVLVREDGLVKRPKFGGGKCNDYVWRKGGPRRKYLRVSINRRGYSVHRLVAETFIPQPFGKVFVDHINRNPRDNRRINLRWVTASENAKNTDKYDNAADYGVRECENKSEYVRRHTLSTYYKKKSDPEWYAKFLERCKRCKERRRRREGKPTRKRAERNAQPS